MAEVHVIFTNFGDEYGWSISSPQFPGIVGGRATIEESIELAPELLLDAGVTEQPDEFFAYLEFGLADPDGNEYLLRILHDDDSAAFRARRDAFFAIYTLIVGGHFDDDDRERQPQLATGERLLISTLGTDTVGSCLDQIKGESATFIQRTGDTMLRSVPFREGKAPGRRSWTTEELELARSDSFDSAFDRLTDAELKAIIEEENGSTKSHQRLDQVLEIPAGDELRRLMA